MEAEGRLQVPGDEWQGTWEVSSLAPAEKSKDLATHRWYRRQDLRCTK